MHPGAAVDRVMLAVVSTAASMWAVLCAVAAASREIVKEVTGSQFFLMGKVSYMPYTRAVFHCFGT